MYTEYHLLLPIVWHLQQVRIQDGIIFLLPCLCGLQSHLVSAARFVNKMLLQQKREEAGK